MGGPSRSQRDVLARSGEQRELEYVDRKRGSSRLFSQSAASRASKPINHSPRSPCPAARAWRPPHHAAADSEKPASRDHILRGDSSLYPRTGARTPRPRSSSDVWRTPGARGSAAGPGPLELPQLSCCTSRLQVPGGAGPSRASRVRADGPSLRMPGPGRSVPDSEAIGCSDSDAAVVTVRPRPPTRAATASLSDPVRPCRRAGPRPPVRRPQTSKLPNGSPSQALHVHWHRARGGCHPDGPP